MSLRRDVKAVGGGYVIGNVSSTSVCRFCKLPENNDPWCCDAAESAHTILLEYKRGGHGMRALFPAEKLDNPGGILAAGSIATIQGVAIGTVVSVDANRLAVIRIEQPAKPCGYCSNPVPHGTKCGCIPVTCKTCAKPLINGKCSGCEILTCESCKREFVRRLEVRHSYRNERDAWCTKEGFCSKSCGESWDKLRKNKIERERITIELGNLDPLEEEDDPIAALSAPAARVAVGVPFDHLQQAKIKPQATHWIPSISEQDAAKKPGWKGYGANAEPDPEPELRADFRIPGIDPAAPYKF